MALLYRPMLFLLVSILLSTFVACQDADGGGGGEDPNQASSSPEIKQDPNAVKSNDKSKGFIGRMQSVINPGTRNIYEAMNAALIRVWRKQLPCTIYSMVPWKAVCTDLPPSQ